MFDVEYGQPAASTQLPPGMRSPLTSLLCSYGHGAAGPDLLRPGGIDALTCRHADGRLSTWRRRPGLLSYTCLGSHPPPHAQKVGHALLSHAAGLWGGRDDGEDCPEAPLALQVVAVAQDGSLWQWEQALAWAAGAMALAPLRLLGAPCMCGRMGGGRRAVLRGRWHLRRCALRGGTPHCAVLRDRDRGDAVYCRAGRPAAQMPRPSSPGGPMVRAGSQAHPPPPLHPRAGLASGLPGRIAALSTCPVPVALPGVPQATSLTAVGTATGDVALVRLEERGSRGARGVAGVKSAPSLWLHSLWPCLGHVGAKGAPRRRAGMARRPAVSTRHRLRRRWRPAWATGLPLP